VDQRSDIFALGIVLFEMLAGQMPFHDESPLKLMLDVVQAPTPDIRALNPEVDDEAARILEKMLAKDPAERYQDCEELNADLKRHPMVRDGGQLSFRPAPWAGANASNPTIVGAPTPLTPGVSARAATPPPVVSSRTPVTGSGSATPAGPAATMAGPPPPRPTQRVGRLAGLVALFLGVCGLTWAYTTGKFNAAPTPATVATSTATTPPPPAPPATPTPPAPPGPVQTATDGATTEEAAALADAERLAAGQAGAQAGAEPAAAVDADGNPIAGPVATVRYGHGGPNGPANRVRVRAVREPSAAELLAREATRRQNELAAQAAAEAAAAAQAPIEPMPTAPAPTQVKKKGFLCRVFKKCDAPATRRANAGRPGHDAQAGQAPSPANEPATTQR
jgi:serine/threonine-protein kinase